MLEDSLCVEKNQKNYTSKCQRCSSLGTGTGTVYSSNAIIFIRNHITLYAENPTNDKKERPRVRVCRYSEWWASASSFSQTLESRDRLGPGWGMVLGPLRTYCSPVEHRVRSCILA